MSTVGDMHLRWIIVDSAAATWYTTGMLSESEAYVIHTSLALSCCAGKGQRKVRVESPVNLQDSYSENMSSQQQYL